MTRKTGNLNLNPMNFKPKIGELKSSNALLNSKSSASDLKILNSKNQSTAQNLCFSA